MTKKATPGEPLTPAMFAVLLSLAGGARHGLGIGEDVELRTSGDTVLPVGTLYRSIARLVDAGLIEPVRPTGDADPRRHYFAITHLGRIALESEAGRLQRLVQWARLLGAVPDLP